MADDYGLHFNPKLDLSKLCIDCTEEEEIAAMALVKHRTPEEMIAEVEYYEKHPTALSSWDMPISFQEYARRVREGDYNCLMGI